ncbi:MAG: hypothetical protein IBX50_17165 [Marinospirillum sp.]|uniref:hypothetical protein n=1 Tax=Marinospirillum sp. TaxID=2183934 RepID=UPI0019FB6FDB|nr:hypothetical protein [Marinospirillum sp.]MBE0508422.1 hypothetical protein [Marinospirillum sp.]
MTMIRNLGHLSPSVRQQIIDFVGDSSDWRIVSGKAEHKQSDNTKLFKCPETGSHFWVIKSSKTSE